MITPVLEQALLEGRAMLPGGEVATYIPELGKANPGHLGICLRTLDGKRFQAGDTDVRFSMQSIAKVIALAVALELCGFDAFDKVGMEPSGDAFNSLVKLEVSSSHPYNPMINSGAIVVCSCIEPELTFKELLRRTRMLCMDPDIRLDDAVFRSEMTHISRNRAIAYLLESKGIIAGNVERVLELYVRLCSLSVTAESLASLGLLLASGGVNPDTGERLLQPCTVQTVTTIMMTCGMYDGSGEFAVRVGIPSKSGVGGGILSTVSQRMGIGIFGPALDPKGNSVAGVRMLEYLSRQLGLHLFSQESRESVYRRLGLSVPPPPESSPPVPATP